jgi:hypothetical protein
MVRVAASLVPSSSAPARLRQRSSQLIGANGKVIPGDDLIGKEKRQQEQPSARTQMTAGLGAAGLGAQTNHNQQSSSFLDESVQARQVDGTSEGVFVMEDQHLGVALDALVGAGISADGGSDNVLGSVMTMAVLSDGELTPVRRSKQNADAADVHSLEKVEKRVAIKNLKDPQGNANAVINLVYSFSSDRIEQNLGGVRISLGGKDKLIAGSIALIKNV